MIKCQIYKKRLVQHKKKCKKNKHSDLYFRKHMDETLQLASKTTNENPGKDKVNIESRALFDESFYIAHKSCHFSTMS